MAFDSRRLCYLSLEECRLGPRLTPLFNALTQNFCLSALHVRDNTLNAAAARALLDALATAVEEYNNTAMCSLLVSGSIYGTTKDDVRAASLLDHYFSFQTKSAVFIS